MPSPRRTPRRTPKKGRKKKVKSDPHPDDSRTRSSQPVSTRTRSQEAREAAVASTSRSPRQFDAPGPSRDSSYVDADPSSPGSGGSTSVSSYCPDSPARSDGKRKLQSRKQKEDASQPAGPEPMLQEPSVDPNVEEKMSEELDKPDQEVDTSNRARPVIKPHKTQEAGRKKESAPPTATATAPSRQLRIDLTRLKDPRTDDAAAEYQPVPPSPGQKRKDRSSAAGSSEETASTSQAAALQPKRTKPNTPSPAKKKLGAGQLPQQPLPTSEFSSDDEVPLQTFAKPQSGQAREATGSSAATSRTEDDPDEHNSPGPSKARTGKAKQKTAQKESFKQKSNTEPRTKAKQHSQSSTPETTGENPATSQSTGVETRARARQQHSGPTERTEPKVRTKIKPKELFKATTERKKSAVPSTGSKLETETKPTEEQPAGVKTEAKTKPSKVKLEDEKKKEQSKYDDAEIPSKGLGAKSKTYSIPSRLEAADNTETTEAPVLPEEQSASKLGDNPEEEKKLLDYPHADFEAAEALVQMQNHPSDFLGVPNLEDSSVAEQFLDRISPNRQEELQHLDSDLNLDLPPEEMKDSSSPTTQTKAKGVLKARPGMSKSPTEPTPKIREKRRGDAVQCREDDQQPSTSTSKGSSLEYQKKDTQFSGVKYPLLQIPSGSQVTPEEMEISIPSVKDPLPRIVVQPASVTHLPQSAEQQEPTTSRSQLTPEQMQTSIPGVKDPLPRIVVQPASVPHLPQSAERSAEEQKPSTSRPQLTPEQMQTSIPGVKDPLPQIAEPRAFGPYLPKNVEPSTEGQEPTPSRLQLTPEKMKTSIPGVKDPLPRIVVQPASVPHSPQSAEEQEPTTSRSQLAPEQMQTSIPGVQDPLPQITEPRAFGPYLPKNVEPSTEGQEPTPSRLQRTPEQMKTSIPDVTDPLPRIVVQPASVPHLPQSAEEQEPTTSRSQLTPEQMQTSIPGVQDPLPQIAEPRAFGPYLPQNVKASTDEHEQLTPEQMKVSIAAKRETVSDTSGETPDSKDSISDSEQTEEEEAVDTADENSQFVENPAPDRQSKPTSGEESLSNLLDKKDYDVIVGDDKDNLIDEVLSDPKIDDPPPDDENQAQTQSAADSPMKVSPFSPMHVSPAAVASTSGDLPIEQDEYVSVETGPSHQQPVIRLTNEPVYLRSLVPPPITVFSESFMLAKNDTNRILNALQKPKASLNTPYTAHMFRTKCLPFMNLISNEDFSRPTETEESEVESAMDLTRKNTEAQLPGPSTYMESSPSHSDAPLDLSQPTSSTDTTNVPTVSTGPCSPVVKLTGKLTRLKIDPTMSPDPYIDQPAGTEITDTQLSGSSNDMDTNPALQFDDASQQMRSTDTTHVSTLTTRASSPVVKLTGKLTRLKIDPMMPVEQAFDSPTTTVMDCVMPVVPELCSPTRTELTDEDLAGPSTYMETYPSFTSAPLQPTIDPTISMEQYEADSELYEDVAEVLGPIYQPDDVRSTSQTTDVVNVVPAVSTGTCSTVHKTPCKLTGSQDVTNIVPTEPTGPSSSVVKLTGKLTRLQLTSGIPMDQLGADQYALQGMGGAPGDSSSDSSNHSLEIYYDADQYVSQPDSSQAAGSVGATGDASNSLPNEENKNPGWNYGVVDSAGFNMYSSHSHISGLNLDENYAPKEVSQGLVHQTNARKTASLIVQMIKQGTLAGRSMLLIGPNGSGKTTIVKAVAEQLGQNVPFVFLSASELNSRQMSKVEALTQAFRKSVAVRLEEIKVVYKGEVVDFNINWHNLKTMRSGEITLRSDEEETKIKLKYNLANSVVENNVRIGDVVSIDMQTKTITVLGTTKHYDIKREGYERMARPSGWLKKRLTRVFEETLHELDVNNCSKYGYGVQALFSGDTGEIQREVRQHVNVLVTQVCREPVNKFVAGVLFIDEAYLLDLECFTFLDNALDSSLAPTVILASNRRITKFQKIDSRSPHSAPIDFLSNTFIVHTNNYRDDEAKHIIRIRIEEEKCKFTDVAIQLLAETALQHTLRCALQLITPSFLVAKRRGASEATLYDIKRAIELFGIEKKYNTNTMDQCDKEYVFKTKLDD